MTKLLSNAYAMTRSGISLPDAMAHSEDLQVNGKNVLGKILGSIRDNLIGT
jgi:hypothetical protein